jgi:hypothetical protein
VPPVSRCWPRVAALRSLSLRLFVAVRVLLALSRRLGLVVAAALCVLAVSARLRRRS